MYSEKTLRCAKCKKITSLSDIRAAKNATDWICVDCYQSEHTKRTPPPRPSWMPRQEESLQETQIQKRTQAEHKQKKTFKCTRCSYSFLVGDSPPLKCPYCGREGTLTQDITSSSILREIEENESRFKKV